MPYYKYEGSDIKAGNLDNAKHAEHFDNPRGYPGLAGLQLKSGSKDRLVEHQTEHAMEKGAELAGTAKSVHSKD